MKKCTVCKQTKTLDEFRKYSGSSPDGKRPLCKVCQREYEKNWRLMSKESRAASRRKSKDKRKVYANGYLLKNRAAYLIAESRRRSVRKGFAFDLDQHVEDVQRRIDLGVCELTGAPFKKTMGPMTWDSPSLDRIVPAAGYVYSNVRIVCRLANSALGNWGEEILKRVMTVWLAREGRPDADG